MFFNEGIKCILWLFDGFIKDVILFLFNRGNISENKLLVDLRREFKVI